MKIKKGMILNDNGGGSRMVLEVYGDLYFLSTLNHQKFAGC